MILDTCGHQRKRGLHATRSPQARHAPDGDPK
jgi:hypothetical protein